MQVESQEMVVTRTRVKTKSGQKGQLGEMLGRWSLQKLSIGLDVQSERKTGVEDEGRIWGTEQPTSGEVLVLTEMRNTGGGLQR